MNWEEIGKRIKSKRQGRFTLKQFGVAVGRKKSNKKPVSHVTVRNWESGSEIKTDNLDAIILALGVSRDWLLNGKETLIQDPNAAYNLNAEILKPTKKVPLISMVQAGDWSEAFDPYQAGFGSSEEECPVPHGDSTFAVRINGESMMPKFEHGEIIFCDPSQRPENKDFVIAKLTDNNEATFKQLVIEDGQSMLKAINPNWHNTYMPINGNCHIVGKVIARLEKF